MKYFICKHNKEIDFCDCRLELKDNTPCPKCNSTNTRVFGVGDEIEMNGYWTCDSCNLTVNIDQ